MNNKQPTKQIGSEVIGSVFTFFWKDGGLYHLVNEQHFEIENGVRTDTKKTQQLFRAFSLWGWAPWNK